jgi:hypothetical protein
MSFFESLAKIFAGIFGKKNTSLDNVSVQDIERERNSYENTLRKKEAEREAKERDKSQLMEDYKAASAAKNEASKRTIAQKLQGIDRTLKAINNLIIRLNKNIQGLDALLLMKETEPETGIIDTIDIGAIQDAAIGRRVAEEERNEKQNAINSSVNEMLNTTGEADFATDDYMAQLDAQLAEQSVGEAAINVSEIDRIDEAIKRGEAAAQKLQEPAATENK